METANTMSLKENNMNYDMQQLMNITGQTAMNVQNMNNQLGIVIHTVNSLSNDVNSIRADIVQLKENEEITTTQQEVINERAKKQICEILGNDPLERQKYYRVFIQRLYADTRRYAGLGSKIARTEKCDYQRCIDYIESWVPAPEVKTKLREKADANAKARLEARKLGYVESKRESA